MKSPTLSPLFSAEFRKFCETTSVRGVPRIIKSKSTGLFIIWLLGVLTCAGLLIWQLVVVFKRFLSYPVSTQLVQAPAWQNATFPDITVCNLCSLVHEKEISMTYKEYTSMLASTLTYERYLQQFGSKSLLSEVDFNDVAQSLLDPMAYFNNFPIPSFNKDENNSAILDCNFFDWNYIRSANKTYCYASSQPIYNANYYKCNTFKVNDVDQKQFRAFSSIFYVDDFRDNQMMPYSLDILSPRSTGLRVMIHPSGTVPNMKLGMNVGPGTDTIITLSQTALTRLPDPYSNCTTQKTLGSATYTQEYCYDVCVQRQYLKECGCIFITFQFTDEQAIESKGTFCGNLAISSDVNNPIDWQGLNELLCVTNFTVDISMCDEECFLPCEEIKYVTSISTAPWPHISAQLSFYETYINGQPRFGEEYDEYQTVYQLAYSNATVANSLLVKLNNEGLIQNNFLQLTVRFDSPSYNEQRDSAAMPANTLGAQIGGILSLWLGMTVILIFEFLEFLYNLACVCKAARCKQSVSSTVIVVESMMSSKKEKY